MRGMAQNLLNGPARCRFDNTLARKSVDHDDLKRRVHRCLEADNPGPRRQHRGVGLLGPLEGEHRRAGLPHHHTRRPVEGIPRRVWRCTVEPNFAEDFVTFLRQVENVGGIVAECAG